MWLDWTLMQKPQGLNLHLFVNYENIHINSQKYDLSTRLNLSVIITFKNTQSVCKNKEAFMFLFRFLFRKILFK